MRRILTALRDARVIQLQAVDRNHPRITEVSEMFNFFDSALSGASLDGLGRFDHAEPKLQEVMISADFTFAIQEFVQRRMHSAYTVQRFEFEQFMSTDTVPNFLPVTRYQNRSELDELEYVGEKGTPRVGSVTDATKRQYQVYMYEKGYDFSFRTLVDDDLGYFNDTTTRMGRAARRSLERFVSRMLFNATTIARLVALGALFFTNGRLTSGRISTARMAFSQRVDDVAVPIAASLVYIVHHTGLLDTVATIQQSTLVPDGAGAASNAANVVRNTFTPVDNPHLAGTAPNLPWMALSDFRQNEIRPFILARRNGVPAPIIVRKRSDVESVTSILGPGSEAPVIMGDFMSGNIKLKVHDEWGTYIDGTDGNLYDHRGAFYGAGTAA